MATANAQKYVRHSKLGFVLWPRTDDLWHSAVGDLLRSVRGDLVSAGFCNVTAAGVRCWGRSESLDIASREDDSACLAAQLGLVAQAPST